MSDLIQTLEEIRDEFAHQRNAFLHPAPGWADKYACWEKDAQRKVDAMNTAICLVQITEVEHA